jgi:hypothetical protein
MKTILMFLAALACTPAHADYVDTDTGTLIIDAGDVLVPVSDAPPEIIIDRSYGMIITDQHMYAVGP